MFKGFMAYIEVVFQLEIMIVFNFFCVLKTIIHEEFFSKQSLIYCKKKKKKRNSPKTILNNKFQCPVLFNIVGERTHLLFLKGLYLDDRKS